MEGLEGQGSWQDFSQATFKLYRDDTPVISKTVMRDSQYQAIEVPADPEFFFETEWEPGTYRLTVEGSGTFSVTLSNPQ